MVIAGRGLRDSGVHCRADQEFADPFVGLFGVESSRCRQRIGVVGRQYKLSSVGDGDAGVFAPGPGGPKDPRSYLDCQPAPGRTSGRSASNSTQTLPLRSARRAARSGSPNRGGTSPHDVRLPAPPRARRTTPLRRNGRGTRRRPRRRPGDRGPPPGARGSGRRPIITAV